MISVLIPCSFYSTYVVQLRRYMKEYHPQLRISILTGRNSARQYIEDIGTVDEGEKVFVYEENMLSLFDVYRVINSLPKFDIIHFLFMERIWCLSAASLGKKAGGVYISVGGSDLYRDAKRIWNRLLQKRLIKKADIISSENSRTREYFNSVHGDAAADRPHRVVRYGVDIIDALRELTLSGEEVKRKNGIDENRLTVVCGYNARTEQQHEQIIEAISRLDGAVLDKIHIVLPVTYGENRKGYINDLERKIKAVTEHYSIIRDYMDLGQMAEMTRMTDIFIHVQTTDQLSSTMVASMYDGNIVVAGSWLPYGDLRENGIKFWSVDECKALTGLLCDIINDSAGYMKECAQNPEKVYGFSSWEHCSNDWYSAYMEILDKKDRTEGKDKNVR